MRASDEMRSAIGSVDHAPTEMVLTRQCADVSKLMYHMRIKGDTLARSTEICQTTLYGRPPQASLAAGWGSARRWGSRFRLRRQPHYVPLFGIDHGRPHQPRLRCPESAHHGRVRLAHRRCSHAPRAKSLRRLAAQLSSLTALEASVAPGVQALLEAPLE